MPKISDADRLRTRGQRMRELATRAHCEKNDDFARLLTQLAIEWPSKFSRTRGNWNIANLEPVHPCAGSPANQESTLAMTATAIPYHELEDKR